MRKEFGLGFGFWVFTGYSGGGSVKGCVHKGKGLALGWFVVGDSVAFKEYMFSKLKVIGPLKKIDSKF